MHALFTYKSFDEYSNLFAAHPNFCFEEVLHKIGVWIIRKIKLFKEEYVRTAYEHLESEVQRFCV